MTAILSPIPVQNADLTVLALGRWRLQRKHLLMLVLAAAVLVMGALRAEQYRPPGITVDIPSTREHVIT